MKNSQVLKQLPPVTPAVAGGLPATPLLPVSTDWSPPLKRSLLPGRVGDVWARPRVTPHPSPWPGAPKGRPGRRSPLPPAPGTAGQSARPAAARAPAATDPGWKAASRKTTLRAQNEHLEPHPKANGKLAQLLATRCCLACSRCRWRLRLEPWAAKPGTPAARGSSRDSFSEAAPLLCGGRRDDAGAEAGRSGAIYLRRGLSAGEKPGCGRIRGDTASSFPAALRGCYPDGK